MHRLGRVVTWSLVLGFVVSLAAVPVSPVGAATRYRDPNGLFSLMVPDGWQPRPQARGSANDALWVNGNGAVAVLHEGVNAGTTSVDYATASVDTLSRLEGFEEFDRRLVSVSGEDRPLLAYAFTAEGTTASAYSVFVTSGTTGYIVSLYVVGDDIADYDADYDAFLAAFAPGTGTTGTATATAVRGGAATGTPRAVGTAATPRAAGAATSTPQAVEGTAATPRATAAAATPIPPATAAVMATGGPVMLPGIMADRSARPGTYVCLTSGGQQAGAFAILSSERYAQAGVAGFYRYSPYGNQGFAAIMFVSGPFANGNVYGNYIPATKESETVIELRTFSANDFLICARQG